MRIHLGANWLLHHVTDRCVELKKDDYAYRRFTDRDGFVRFRAEPGMDRNDMIEGALKKAMVQDEALALRVAKQLIPSGRALERYRTEQRRLARAFSTPDDEASIGRKRA